MKLRRYRPFALLMLLLHLGACAHWEPTTVSPPQLIADHGPMWVRITRMDGVQEILRYPEIRADSIVGTSDARRETSVPISDIRQIETRRGGVGTPLLVFVGVGLAFALIQAGDLGPRFSPR